MTADGKDERRITVLGPWGGAAMIHFDVSPRDQIAWVQFRPGKKELWLADMP